MERPRLNVLKTFEKMICKIDYDKITVKEFCEYAGIRIWKQENYR